MAAKLDSLIPVRSLDILRTKIISILNEELANQYTLSGDTDEDYVLTTTIERYDAFNQNEFPVLNLRFIRSENISQDATGSIEKYTFWLEFYVSKESTDNDLGDKLGLLQVSKILGACRYILKSSPYQHLDLPRPMIGRVLVSTVEVSDYQNSNNETDAMSIMYGRLTLEIDACEGVGLITPGMIEEHESIIKLYETEKGYTWLTT